MTNTVPAAKRTTPIITGMIVDMTGLYYWAFVIAAAVPVVGLFGWVVLIERVEPSDWDTARQSHDPATSRP